MRVAAIAVSMIAGCGGGGGAQPDARAIDARALPANVVFVTADDRPVSGGIEGADAFCAAQAARYHLAGTYVAWLSTSTIDARDRLAGSRGWVRPDGRPFAASVEDLVAGRIYYPSNVFPTGERATALATMTGTNPDGTAAAETCEDWSSTDSGLEHAAGNSGATTVAWTSSFQTSCGDSKRVYCFGLGLDVDVAPEPTPGRLVFVSSPWQPGGGIASADAHCNAEAAAAGRTGAFVAYLTVNFQPPQTRLADGPPWVRVDGVPIADTAALAIEGRLEAARNLTLDGQPVSTRVWRGGNQPCDDWTTSNPAIDGSTIDAEVVDEPVVGQSASCAQSHPLLCYET